MSAFSSANISPEDLARVMKRIGGRFQQFDPWRKLEAVGKHGPEWAEDDSMLIWVVERKRHRIWVDIGTDDIASLLGHLLKPIERKLGDKPRSRVAFILAY